MIRLCRAPGCRRVARYRSPTRRRYLSDAHHDLCPRCAQAAKDRTRAARMAAHG